MIELALRLLGIGAPAHDPLSGFNQYQPLFEKAGSVYRTVRARELCFGPQQFAAQKPANGFRIFTFGGSTVYGHPYQNETAFPKWLELELAANQPFRKIESINCGGISYASYRLALIVHEVLQYQPDLIVLAMGHNEFLEDRTYQEVKTHSGFRRWLEARFCSLHTANCALKILRPTPSGADTKSSLAEEVKPRLDAGSGYASYHRDDLWHEQVIRQFEDSFRAMIAECQAAHVPVIVVALGSNLRDCPPFKSEHKAGLSPQDEARWQTIFDAGTRLDARDPAGALAQYQKAAALDDQYALLTYRMARCYDRLGQIPKARELYIRSKDQDICPLRMLEKVYELQHAIAAETKTPLVEARQMLEGISPDGLPGFDLYLDHVHPSLGAHQKIARAIAEQIRKSALMPGLTTWSDDARQSAYRVHFAALDRNYFTNGRRRVDWLDNWARRQLLHEETLPVDARGFLYAGMRFLDLGQDEQAWAELETALDMKPAVAQALIAHALTLNTEGRAEAAVALLEHLGGVLTDAAAKASAAQALRTIRGL